MTQAINLPRQNDNNSLTICGVATTRVNRRGQVQERNRMFERLRLSPTPTRRSPSKDVVGEEEKYALSRTLSL